MDDKTKAERIELRKQVANGRPLACVALVDDSEAAKAYARYNRSGDPATAGINYRGEPCPSWEELTENVRNKWRGMVGAIVVDDVEYEAEASKRKGVDVLADFVFSTFLNRPSASLADVPPNDRIRWLRIAMSVYDVWGRNERLSEMVKALQDDERRKQLIERVAEVSARLAVLEDENENLRDYLDSQGERAAALAKGAYDISKAFADFYYFHADTAYSVEFGGVPDFGDSDHSAEDAELRRAYGAIPTALRILEAHAEVSAAYDEAEAEQAGEAPAAAPEGSDDAGEGEPASYSVAPPEGEAEAIPDFEGDEDGAFMGHAIGYDEE